MSATVFLADSGTGIWISFLDLPLFPDRSSSFIPCSYLSLSILLLMLTMPLHQSAAGFRPFYCLVFSGKRKGNNSLILCFSLLYTYIGTKGLFCRLLRSGWEGVFDFPTLLVALSTLMRLSGPSWPEETNPPPPVPSCSYYLPSS